RVKGDTFLALKYEMLVNPPLGIPVGPAVKLVEFINKIHGGKRTSFSLTPCHIREYLLILVLFFPASYRKKLPKKHIYVIVESTVTTESPNKRRKYDNDDEKLGRFWNALKDGKVEKHDGGQFL
ncbi:7261_t:CDS:2, partial [Ambispora leptoticha]